MSQSWYFTYLCDIAIPPTNVIFRRKYNINIYDNDDIDIIINDFDFYINANVGDANIQFNDNIRNAYLFAYIVDTMNMIEDSANKYGYKINMTSVEDVSYENVEGNIYRIYIRVFRNINVDENILINLAEGKTESIMEIDDDDLPLTTFSGRVNYLDDFDFPNNIWILDNRYIILQRYANDGEDGLNMLQGPIGIVELDPNVPTPQEVNLQVQQMFQQALNAPIALQNNFIPNRGNIISSMRYMQP